MVKPSFIFFYNKKKVILHLNIQLDNRLST